MDDSIKKLEALAKRARMEIAPAPDVSLAVMTRLRQTEETSERPLLIIAFASCVAAGILGAPSLLDVMDPLFAFFQSSSLMM